MKKLSIVFFCLFLYSAIKASPVDSTTARLVGYNFLSSKTIANKLGSANTLQLAYTATSKDGSPCFYVFNTVSLKAFVIVAADDAVKPILGYSTQNPFPTITSRGIPSQIANWMDGYAKQIAVAVQNNAAANPKTKTAWQQLQTAQSSPNGKYVTFGTSVVAPLLQTYWDQSRGYFSPWTYNALCPYDSNFNDRALTGCTATAIAQVLKYWGYPANGTGSKSYLPITAPYFGQVSENFNTVTYNYANMPDSLTASSTPAQVNAVAKLMYDCGVSVNMQFGTGWAGGSGADAIFAIDRNFAPNAQTALVTNFGYDNSLQGLAKANYSDSAWIALLENEFDNKRPVIYEGWGNVGGHVWVADGYDNNGYIHFNFGYGGKADGFFSVDKIVFNLGGSDTLTNRQGAIIGIQPHLVYTANTADSLALVDFFNNTGGLNWTNNDRWLSAPLSNWYGVVLNPDGRVAGINLSGNNLSGSIPSSFGSLAELTSLNLSNNNFSGSIPPIIGQLNSLISLDLSFNNFSDTLPNIPTGTFPHLYYLNISNNQLTGTIPSSFSALDSLTFLDLSHNQLSGTVPTASFPLLIMELDLSSNQFSGAVPASLNNFDSLYFLNLSNNQLSGTLPSLSNIGPYNFGGYLYFANNQLSGSVPTGFSSYITYLDLSNNQLSGSLPSNLYKMASLKYLDLSGNQLSGTISSSINGLTNLIFLSLAYNQLTGSIPTTISALTKMGHLNFSHNQLSGSIPNSIEFLYTWLSTLDLSYNQLTGPIPQGFIYLYALTNFNLSNNQLSGSIPNVFGNSHYLQAANIANNKFVFSGMCNVARLYRPSITTITYSPQATVPLKRSGDTLLVSVGDTLKNNTYYWYNDLGLVKTIAADSVFVPASNGNYYVAVKNATDTALTLYSDTFMFQPLPITWLSFTATAHNEDALLDWQTANELNTSHFNVQRSTDGSSFANIGSVKAKGSRANSYSFIDIAPSHSPVNNGMIYYRLQSVDKDGANTYSKTVAVSLTTYDTRLTTVSVYPNPVKDVLTIGGNHIASVQVIDNLGRIIKVVSLNDATNPTINMGGMAQGVYHLRIATMDGKVNNQVIMVN